MCKRASVCVWERERMQIIPQQTCNTTFIVTEMVFAWKYITYAICKEISFFVWTICERTYSYCYANAPAALTDMKNTNGSITSFANTCHLIFVDGYNKYHLKSWYCWLECVCVCVCVRSGDILVWRVVQPPPGSAEPPQQGHQECGKDRAQLISFFRLSHDPCDCVFVSC